MELIDDIPASQFFGEPKSYYKGMDARDRPLCRNVIVFERLSRQKLQQRQLSNRLHHRYVFMRVLKTSGVVSVNGTSTRLEAGDALLIAPYQFHHYIQLDSDDLRWVFVTFELERGESALADISGRVLRFDQAAGDLWARSITFGVSGDERLLPSLDWVLTHLKATSGLQRLNQVASSDAWISKVESLILESVQSGWTLEEVARRVSISDRHMRARFEAHTGFSPKDYRANYQLHLALSMMREPGRTFSEIAERCGYQSPSVFNRFIRRMTSMTPSEVRKRLLAGSF